MTLDLTKDYKQAHVLSVEYNTLVDETFTGGEQRRDVWSTPRHTWQLDFEKNNLDTADLITFFNDKKGRKNSFKWTWTVDKGGDGQERSVRFGSDKLDLNMLEMKYSTFSITLVQVVA